FGSVPGDLELTDLAGQLPGLAKENELARLVVIRLHARLEQLVREKCLTGAHIDAAVVVLEGFLDGCLGGLLRVRAGGFRLGQRLGHGGRTCVAPADRWRGRTLLRCGPVAPLVLSSPWPVLPRLGHD